MKLGAALAVSLGIASTAAADPPDFPDVVSFTVSATATLASKTDHYAAVGPLLADKATEDWCEGKPGGGVGEALVVDFAAPIAVTSLRIAANTWGPAFEKNNRISELTVSTDDGRDVAVTIPDRRDAVDVPIGGKPVKELRLVIAKVARGKVDRSCISRVELQLAQPTSLVFGVDPAALSALEPAFAAIFGAIESCDAAAIKRHAVFPLPYRSIGGDEDSKTTRRMASAPALAKLCHKRVLGAFIHAATGLTILSTGKPNVVDITDEPVIWHLAFRRGEWKLVGLEDDTQ